MKGMKRALLVLVAALAWTGCGDDGTDLEEVSGRYELRTVNGSNLPYTVFQLGNDRIELLSGYVQLNADATFSTANTSRTTQGGQTSTDTQVDNGSWTQTGNQLRFTFADNSQATGVLSGNEITVIEGQVSFVFRK